MAPCVQVRTTTVAQRRAREAKHVAGGEHPVIGLAINASKRAKRVEGKMRLRCCRVMTRMLRIVDVEKMRTWK